MKEKTTYIKWDLVYYILISLIGIFYSLTYLFKTHYHKYNFSEVLYLSYQYELPIVYRIIIYFIISFLFTYGFLYFYKIFIKNKIIKLNKKHNFIIVFFLILTLILLIINFYKTFIRSYDDFIFTYYNLDDLKKVKKNLIKSKPTIENKIILDTSIETNQFSKNDISTFQSLYKRGYRIFKIDFILLPDGEIVPYTNSQILNFNNPFTSNKETMGRSLEELLQLIKIYNDIYFIVNAKYLQSNLSYNKYQKRFWKNFIQNINKIDTDLYHRIIPEIESKETFYLIESIYRFDNYIFKMDQEVSMSYEDIIKLFVFNPRIMNVAIPASRINDEILIKILKNTSRIIFIYNIIENNNLRDFLNKGADGFYTNFITTNDFFTLNIKKIIQIKDFNYETKKIDNHISYFSNFLFYIFYII